MRWFKGKGGEEPPEEPKATNAQVGYMLSLMDELDIDSLQLEVEDPDTGERTAGPVVERNQVGRLRKGDASQVITQLLKVKENPDQARYGED